MHDFRHKPLSWSSISSFRYDPEQWARKYIDGIEQTPTKEILFGKEVGEKLASDPSFLPGVPRHSVFEYPLATRIGERNLIGFVDSYEPHTSLLEYKTGKKAWDQKRVEEHGQFDMYLLMLYAIHAVRPEDVRLRLVWLPTQENGDFTISFVPDMQPVIFETKRTMADIIRFGAFINEVYKEMLEYAERRAAANAA